MGFDSCLLPYMHKCLPFGAVASVWHYNLISQEVCHILRDLFALPQIAYVDDYLRAMVAKYAVIGENAFRRVHGMLGIPFKIGSAIGRDLHDPPLLDERDRHAGNVVQFHLPADDQVYWIGTGRAKRWGGPGADGGYKEDRKRSRYPFALTPAHTVRNPHRAFPLVCGPFLPRRPLC